VEYKPVEWVKIFRQSNSQNFKRRDLQISKNLPNLPEISDMSGFSPASIRPVTTAQGTRENNINRVINTVFII